MRTIKFRVQAIDNSNIKYWIYFDLSNSEENPIAKGEAFGNNILKETVGQFTGLLDKNGKEIFEHDIVQGISKNAVYEVFYNQDLCGFSTKIGLVGLLECTVIGNAIDNPELLKD